MARDEVLHSRLSVAVVLFLAGAIIPMSAAGEVLVDVTNVFHPTGLIGDKADVSISTEADGSTKIVYSGEVSGRGWAGVYWQYPKYNWGDHPGLDLSKATKLTFKARGQNGGERAEFMIGGIEGGRYEDTITPPISTGVIELARNWTDYKIDFLKSDDLSQVIGGFCWLTTENTTAGETIYLKEIRFEA